MVFGDVHDIACEFASAEGDKHPHSLLQNAAKAGRNLIGERLPDRQIDHHFGKQLFVPAGERVWGGCDGRGKSHDPGQEMNLQEFYQRMEVLRTRFILRHKLKD